MTTDTKDTDTPTDTGPTCGLGHKLNSCALRAAGCERLYDVLVFLYPPFEILDEMRRRDDLTPAGWAWVQRLDTIYSPVNSIKNTRE